MIGAPSKTGLARKPVTNLALHDDLVAVVIGDLRDALHVELPVSRHHFAPAAQIQLAVPQDQSLRADAGRRQHAGIVQLTDVKLAPDLPRPVKRDADQFSLSNKSQAEVS